MPPSPPGLVLPETPTRAERVKVVPGGGLQVRVLGSQRHVVVEQPPGQALTLLRAAHPQGPWSKLLRSECSPLNESVLWAVTGDWAERETYVLGIPEPCARGNDGRVLAPAGTALALGACVDVSEGARRVRLVEVLGADVDDQSQARLVLP